MGNIYTPSYGNIFMDHFERKHLSLHFLLGPSLIYLRLIDDTFLYGQKVKNNLFGI